jgi:hypothetical protein
MQHLGSKFHIKDYVTPQYYDIFLVSQRCQIKEVRLYDGSMIHATYFWILMNINMGAFLECGNGFEAGMGGSTLGPQ